MADATSDSTLVPAPAASSQHRNAQASQQTQQKRNNRSRRNNQELSGAVSDGLETVSSPRPRKGQNKQRQGGAAKSPQPPNAQMGNNTTTKTRPISVGGPVIHTTPAKEQAYAGPTFHASPAASALPVPKFFSKSVPNIAAKPSLQGRLDGEKSPGDSGSSPESDTVLPAPNRNAQQSPLDILFRADRAEKERTRSATQPLSPGAARLLHPSDVPHRPHQQHGKGVFLSELDGDNDMPSPRTIPKSGRPGAGERSTSFPGVAHQTASSEQEREAYTRNLKDLLFQAASTPPATSPNTLSRNNSGSQTPDGVFGSPSPSGRPRSGPSTPQPSNDQHTNYSLHYGNRNLSPMFKTARADNSSRPSSSLRQEVPNEAFASPGSDRPGSADTNAFARSYLQEQIRTSAPVELPPLPFQPSAKPTYRAVDSSAGAAIPGPPSTTQQFPAETAGSTTPRTGASRDIRFMERGADDLRRILKLNV